MGIRWGQQEIPHIGLDQHAGFRPAGRESFEGTGGFAEVLLGSEKKGESDRSGMPMFPRTMTRLVEFKSYPVAWRELVPWSIITIGVGEHDLPSSSGLRDWTSLQLQGKLVSGLWALVRVSPDPHSLIPR